MKYTEPRYTKDLDLWIDNDLANARRLHQALTAFGAPITEYSPENFTRPGMVYQIGVPPLRVDMLTSLPSLNFREAWSRRVRTRSGGEPLSFVSLDDLIKSKRKAGRLQDKLDLENLEEARSRQRSSRV